MSICKFNQVKGFWKSMSFTRNPFKMRKVLSDFLFKEGLKCNIEDGLCYIEYEKHQYKVFFCQHNNYAECIILFDEDNDDYNSLGISDKTYIADKANTDLENHCKVYAFNNGIKINTSFYFTNKKMMLDLFGEHFAEMTENDIGYYNLISRNSVFSFFIYFNIIIIIIILCSIIPNKIICISTIYII